MHPKPTYRYQALEPRPPTCPQPVRAEDIYPAEHMRDGLRPDTQPISREAFEQLARAARQPRTASPADRVARAMVCAVSSAPLGGLFVALGACAQGVHGALAGLSLAAVWATVRACAGLADSAPL